MRSRSVLHRGISLSVILLANAGPDVALRPKLASNAARLGGAYRNASKYGWETRGLDAPHGPGFCSFPGLWPGPVHFGARKSGSPAKHATQRDFQQHIWLRMADAGACQPKANGFQISAVPQSALRRAHAQARTPTRPSSMSKCSLHVGSSFLYNGNYVRQTEKARSTGNGCRPALRRSNPRHAHPGG